MKEVIKLNNRNIELNSETIKNKKLLNALEYCHKTRQRVRIFYGENGISWNEEHDIMGYISNSTGKNAILILVNNSKSLGGGSIIDHKIIRIDIIETRKTIYKDENFKVNLELRNENELWDTSKNEVYSSHKTKKEAENFLEFLKGNRYRKN